VTDDRISRYLHDQASAIALRPSTPASVMDRARHRRQVRRASVMAAAVVTLAASTLVVTRGDENPAELTAQSAAVTPSALDWSVVEAASGLSADRYGGSVVSADGAVYSLSTAPGPFDPDSTSAPATLYRSTDGAEWSPVGMPDDFWPTSLAGQGSRLYTVGTAPAGGAVTYRLARSDDGGSTWSTAEIPSDLVALMERYPDEVVASAPTVAVHDGTVVVSGSVSAYLDFEGRIPGFDYGLMSRFTDDGLEVGPPACGVADGEIGERTVVTEPPSAEPAPPPADTSSPPPDTSSPTTVTVPASASGPDPVGSAECMLTDDRVVHTYTWEELGVDDDLRDLVTTGRTYVYVAHDGGEFAPADTGGPTAGRAQVVAADDGFTLFLGRGTDGVVTTDVMRSVDGALWEPAGELDGEVANAGIVAGRAAAAVAGGDDYATTVRLAQADGSWLTVDPRTALDEPVDTMVSQVAFGPLGWAATLWGGDGREVHAVHSVDGTSMSVVPLHDLLDPPSDEVPYLEPAVTADAVLLRVTDTAADDDPTTVPPQRVVVGTTPG
jgi:hypothetical protein